MGLLYNLSGGRGGGRGRRRPRRVLILDGARVQLDHQVEAFRARRAQSGHPDAHEATCRHLRAARNQVIESLLVHIQYLNSQLCRLFVCTQYTSTVSGRECRVRLSKRRKQDISLQAQRTRLIVRQHEPNPEEVSEREERRAYLMSEELPVEEYKPDAEGDEQNEGAVEGELKPAEDAEELEAAGEEPEGDDDLKPQEEPMEETGDAAEDNADDEFKPNADGLLIAC